MVRLHAFCGQQRTDVATWCSCAGCHVDDDKKSRVTCPVPGCRVHRRVSCAILRMADEFKRILKAGWGWIVLGVVIGVTVAILVILTGYFSVRFWKGDPSLTDTLPWRAAVELVAGVG